ESKRIDARQRQIEDERIGAHATDADEGFERIREGGDFEAASERTPHCGEHARVGVEHGNFRLAASQQLRNRVPVLVEKVQDIEPPEAKVPARGPKMPNFAFFDPIVDGFEVDVAEAGKLAGGKKLRRGG